MTERFQSSEVEVPSWANLSPLDEASLGNLWSFFTPPYLRTDRKSWIT